MAAGLELCRCPSGGTARVVGGTTRIDLHHEEKDVGRTKLFHAGGVCRTGRKCGGMNGTSGDVSSSRFAPICKVRAVGAVERLPFMRRKLILPTVSCPHQVNPYHDTSFLTLNLATNRSPAHHDQFGRNRGQINGRPSTWPGVVALCTCSQRRCRCSWGKPDRLLLPRFASMGRQYNKHFSGSNVQAQLTSKPQTGRQEVLTRREKRCIAQLAKRNPQFSTQLLTNIADTRISQSTVRRVLRQLYIRKWRTQKRMLLTKAVA